ncbi:putative mitochondrial protein [Cucumis melo var. makuwa]|uniref:Mitochondrial protein n=1 Tax=Cucumis melo var. makuwa TaxID=1194695 RepID=A0A5A7TZM7_CUCMM|nr:putative mitochondrial protein [Cucumis melo var. makuwa]
MATLASPPTIFWGLGREGATIMEEMRVLEKQKTEELCAQEHKTMGYVKVEIVQLEERMGDEFEIKDSGSLKYFLGMEVARSRKGIFVSQRKYTLDLLTKTGMAGYRPADTPIELNAKLGNFVDKVPVVYAGSYKEHRKAVN